MKITFLQKFFSLFKEIWFLWALCLLFNIITFFVVQNKLHSYKGTLALHYNILVGVDWFGPGANLYFIPIIGFLISLINLSLYGYLKDSENFLFFLTAFVSLVVQLILLFAVLLLVAVN